MSSSLDTLLADGVIDEVIGRVKTGKEAEVFLVRHHDEVLAAKVYKERHQRNFRNNATYTEGRTVRNTRTQRAMEKGSRFGQQASDEEWKTSESNALHTLYAAGVKVPKPHLFYEGVLLMEVVVDPNGHVAPRLVDAALTAETAAQLYAVLRAEVVKMLCADLVHGDLSEFNVLLAWNGPVIIDFPQVVKAAQNSRAEVFLRRDMENLRRFFGGFDPAVAARVSDADEVWRAYTRRELTPDFVPTGRAPVQRRSFENNGPRREQGPGKPRGDGRGPQRGRPNGAQQGGGSRPQPNGNRAASANGAPQGGGAGGPRPSRPGRDGSRPQQNANRAPAVSETSGPRPSRPQRNANGDATRGSAASRPQGQGNDATAPRNDRPNQPNGQPRNVSTFREGRPGGGQKPGAPAARQVVEMRKDNSNYSRSGSQRRRPKRRF